MIPLREIFKALATTGQSRFHGRKRIGYFVQVLHILFEFDLYQTRESGFPRQLRSGGAEVAVLFHQRLKAHAFEALHDGAAVPSQGFSRGLEIEAVLP